MVDIKYSETDNLKPQEIDELKQLVGSYMQKFENQTKGFLLEVKVKKRHLLGTVGRFSVKLMIDSPDGKFYAEQGGWGLTKTVRRCAEHMRNQLEHKLKKDMLSHKPRKLKR